MNTPVDFFDAFQQRIDDLYTTKFRIDEASRQGRRQGEGALDEASLYLTLAVAHDQVRAIDFEAIQSRRWQEKVLADQANPVLIPFYNIFTRLAASSAVNLAEYSARHIVLNYIRPLTRYSTQEYPDGQFAITTVTKESEINSLITSAASVLKVRPYLVFLHCLSTCETYLPTGKAHHGKKD